jgi:glycine reductase complex component B subunit gamma
MRVVHYLNQFFGGVGGEESADLTLEARNGAVGPGKLLEQLLGGEAQVVMSLVCGDNYAVENQQAMLAAALQKIAEAKADLFVAGPCFQAGRYGMAAGALCCAVQSKIGIPVITGMARENPGADLYREPLFIIDSGDNPAKMRDVLTRMASLAKKLVGKEAVGYPKEEGYIPRGLIRDQFVEQTAAERLVQMVLAKVKGEPFESEMTAPVFAPVPMPTGVKDLGKAKLMLITDGGLVPKGNPDKIQGSAATRWGSYSIQDCAELRGENYEISHGGYDPQFVRQDPNRLVPLDVMREFEREGAIGELCNEFFSTSGLANPLSNTRRWDGRWPRKPSSWASTRSYSLQREGPARAAVLRSRQSSKRPGSQRCKSLRRGPSPRWWALIAWCSATESCMW